MIVLLPPWIIKKKAIEESQETGMLLTLQYRQ